MRHVIETDGGYWVTREQAIKEMGVSEGDFDRLRKHGLIKSEGEGKRLRFDAVDVWTCARLWSKLSPLMDLAEREIDKTERAK